tara:strand:- start:1712 stop:2263 length:552 start_codon:yes stop_codon:yes gene_type:complete
MFAELAAIGSALSAINSTISTLKESKANASDAVSLLSKFGTASTKLDKWEAKTKSKRPLTPKEAMDLSIHRRKIKMQEQQIKDICLMSGCADVWHEAQRIRAQSERDHKDFLKTAHIRRKQRKEKITSWAIALFISVSLVAIAGTGFVLHNAYEKVQLKDAKERLKKAKERQRNIRKCGRVKC